MNGRSLFYWEGDVAEAAKIEEQVREISKLGNTKPDILAQSVAYAVAKRGGLVLGPTREVEKIALTYLALSFPTKSAGRPGCVRDYIPVWDFDVDVGCDFVAKRFSVNLRAESSVHQG